MSSYKAHYFRYACGRENNYASINVGGVYRRLSAKRKRDKY